MPVGMARLGHLPRCGQNVVCEFSCASAITKQSKEEQAAIRGASVGTVIAHLTVTGCPALQRLLKEIALELEMMTGPVAPSSRK